MEDKIIVKEPRGGMIDNAEGKYVDEIDMKTKKITGYAIFKLV